MKLGALIVTTGLPGCSGIDVLLPEVGTIPAGQRMIASFQRAGVGLTGLVVEGENKKAERTFAQNGVIFLRCREKATFFQGMQQGLSFLQKRRERIFVVTGNTSPFLPQTLRQLLENQTALSVPEYTHVCSFPLLLNREGIDYLLQLPAASVLEDVLRNWPLSKEIVFLQKEGMRYDARFSALLHLVEETHSVRDACGLMQISYSSAWNMLNQAEDQLGFPLIIRAWGGSEGSGSELTEKGRRLMEAYDRFAERLQQIAEQLYQEILPE